MISQKSFFVCWVVSCVALSAIACGELSRVAVAAEKAPLPTICPENLGSPEELGPPTVYLDTAASPTIGSKPVGVATAVTVTPVASDQSMIDELVEVRRRVGGVTSSSSRFQAELVRLIQADRERSTEEGGKRLSPSNLTTAAAEAPHSQQLSASAGDATTSDPQRGALQIAMLRALAEELEGLANQLEREDSFTAADALRERSGQFREQARRLWTSLPAAREALRQLPTVSSGSPFDPSGVATPPTVTLPSVPVPVPDPPAKRQPNR